jgi:hypothetical protein
MQVIRASRVKTKTEAIIIAMKEYLRKKKLEKLINYSGKIKLKIDLEKLRKNRI